jgi:uroporphyrin-III C-methyltransferase
VTGRGKTRARASKRRPAREGLGLASLVGAGPGDPELLTVRALDRLREADLVLYDGLVPKAIVSLASGAQCVSVARRVGPKALAQDEVSDRIIAAARAGLRVVRLKAGDPFVFGRGGEEAQALAAAQVPFEVVPGLSTALAAPALAGIPVTYRGLSAAVVVVSGHDKASFGPVLRRLEPGTVTVVVLMGLGRRREVARVLRRAGWKASTPVAIVIDASQPSQKIWAGRLSALGLRDGVASRESPGVIVVGSAVSAVDAARSWMARGV